MTIGAIYSMSKNVAVMPYIARSFKSVEYYDSLSKDLNNGAMIIGVKFGVQF
jgi:hypothetical protein